MSDNYNEINLILARELVSARADIANCLARIDRVLALARDGLGSVATGDYYAGVAASTTAVHVSTVLASSRSPLSIPEIADQVAALRGIPDSPRAGGGTRIQEMVRNALIRMRKRGRVEVVNPDKRGGFARYQLVSAVGK